MKYANALKFKNLEDLNNYVSYHLIPYRRVIEKVEFVLEPEVEVKVVTAGKNGFPASLERELKTEDIAKNERGVTAEGKAMYSFTIDEFEYFMKEIFGFVGDFCRNNEEIVFVEREGEKESKLDLIKELIEQAVYMEDISDKMEALIEIAKLLGMTSVAEEATVMLADM